jgi:hypothetical protein
MHPHTRSLSLTLVALLALLPTAIAPVAAQDASPEPTATSPASPAPAASPSVTQAGECVEPEETPPPLSETPLSIPEEYRIALFDGVWEGIRDYYWDVDTAGLDWEAVGDEYAPLIIGTDNAYEVYELLAEMVELLDDPFTGFYAPEDLGDRETYDPCLLYTSPSPRDRQKSRMPSSA